MSIWVPSSGSYNNKKPVLPFLYSVAVTAASVQCKFDEKLIAI